MKITVRSLQWIEELQRRQEALRSERLSARLRVSEELAWWYFQEFGTASRATAGETGGFPGAMPRDSQGRYLILPVYAKELRFPGPDGEEITAQKVWHPGVYPRAFVRNALDDIMKDFAATVAPYVATGQMNLAQEALMNEVMQRALELIVEQIDQELIGTRDDGRLGGQTAGEAFSEGAEIVQSE